VVIVSVSNFLACFAAAVAAAAAAILV
jgi:hypothetical protein